MNFNVSFFFNYLNLKLNQINFLTCVFIFLIKQIENRRKEALFFFIHFFKIILKESNVVLKIKDYKACLLSEENAR